MKKVIGFTLLMMMTTFGWTDAQTGNETERQVYLGTVAGFGTSRVRNLAGNIYPVFAYNAGIAIIRLENTHWGWGGKFLFSSEGYKSDYLTAQIADVPLYLRMPLRGYYFFGKRSRTVRPDVYLGPSFALKTGEHITMRNYYGDVTRVQNASNFRVFDAGIDGGAGVNIQISQKLCFNMDLGYYQGLTDAVKDRSDTYDPTDDVDFNLSLLFDLR